MATRRQEEEHPTPEQRAVDLVNACCSHNLDEREAKRAELTAIIRENEELKSTLKATTDCVDTLHAYETIAKQQSEINQLRKVCDEFALIKTNFGHNAKNSSTGCVTCIALANYNNLPHVKGKI